ncbi:tetratricopeptide repeat protein [Azospirillum doebereinerae]|uniref:Tetratricopeptide repeat protein n=1 Tax=Azospirillum doebereinerae TaxID=92933 RepID=A0A3S0WS93_9PROT|nr:tetratricopeptide repeat protein [Azospirillum doebereinerae]MCG5243672.1 tetratricopeptide repeat protein [Azospirillum doebereinerae]RUQ66233.1 tetratricopeptide repeat protein [Azospirillum doebereinerae]
MASIGEALALALDHLKAGRHAQAETLYGRILDADPGNPEALHRLGLLAALRGEHDRALPLLARSVEIAEAAGAPDPDALFNLATVLHVLLRTEEAIATYRRAVALRPDFPDAEYQLSEALQGIGRIGEALATLDVLLTRHPHHPKGWRQHGDIEAALGRPGAAVTFYEMALALDPADDASAERLTAQAATFHARRAALDARRPDGRHDLRDTTFLIPFRADSEDRKRNLRWIAAYLLKHADTTVLIGEDKDGPSDVPDALGPELAARCRHLHLTGNDTPFTHKAHLLNRMVEVADTPVVALHDTDIVVDPVQYVLARDAARAKDGKGGLVFPYNGLFFWIMGREVFRFGHTLSAAPLNAVCKHFPLMHNNSPGGGAFFDRAQLLAAGGYNENFLSWGYEDDEIVERFHRLGLPVKRTAGPLYHLEHARPENSTDLNPFIDANRAELERIRAMDGAAIRADIAAGRLRRPLLCARDLPAREPGGPPSGQAR